MESGGGNHQASGKTGNLWLSGDLWELGSSWGSAFNNPTVPISSSFFPTTQPTQAATASSFHHPQPQSSSICSAQNGESHHLTCLKLGKRQYYEEAHVPMKRERVLAGGSASAASSSSAGSVAVVPRCQVEGCNVALLDAKDYHRRHKVCEIHSKAPRVVVLGLEQRFCQQCSRFHVISEFDDSKRSCRRRLAGHNERRRKSASESISRNPSLDYNLTTGATLPTDNSVMGGGFPFMPSSTSPNRALSLLSSKSSPWVSSDLSSRSSAALRELIAENRAALLARQLFSDHGWHNSSPGTTAILNSMPHQHELPLEAPAQIHNGWDNFREAGAHLTLDLMQMPSSSFEILSGRNKSKDEEEECCEIWKSLEGTHVV